MKFSIHFADMMFIIVGIKESQVVLSQALEHMRRYTSSQLLQMKKGEQFVGVDWKMLDEYLPEPFLEELNAEPNAIAQQKEEVVSSEQPSQPSTTSIDAIVSLNDSNDEHRQNIRKELVIRFLTALSLDYEKQWYLGMIHRRTLDILIKSVEKAKETCSLELHWQLLVKHFRMSFFLRHLIKFDHFDLINKCTNNLLFDHIILTVELAFGE